ncbi:MAG: hypothetical protein HYU36_10780 [Planctomycetes bacterium]|nr:hypothetical protein [Planctomycetota bacterium]
MAFLWVFLSLFVSLGAPARANSIAIGVHDQSVNLWRYWSVVGPDLKPVQEMLVVNASDQALQFCLKSLAANGLCFTELKDPTSSPRLDLQPRALVRVGTQSLSSLADAQAPFVRLHVQVGDDARMIGTLSSFESAATLLRDSMDGVPAQHRYVALEGMNLFGGVSSHAWWEFDSPAVESGKTANLTLRLTPMASPFPGDDPREVKFYRSAKAAGADGSEPAPLAVIQVTSTDFEVKADDEKWAVTVPWKAAGNEAIGARRKRALDIQVTVQAPSVAHVALAMGRAWHSLSKGSGAHLGPTLVVLPTGARWPETAIPVQWSAP